MLKISSVEPGSPAHRAGLAVGDSVFSLNGHEVRDLLDLHFRMSGSVLLRLGILQNGRERKVRVRREPWEGLGLAFSPEPVRRCGNKCIFCFIDQNPPSLRSTLYVKDEDYRLSFLHGNYVTLTNLREWELNRIIEQRLSPLYVSVHSLNPAVRRRLFRSRSRSDIRPVLAALDRAGIRLHVQIVLVPGYNDGRDLGETLQGLASMRDSVTSVGIVPVGLTRHRKGLPELRPVSAREARGLVERIEPMRRAWRREGGTAFAYLADELYLAAGCPVPSEKDYDGYPQIENGIGLMRRFTVRLGRLRRVFRESPRRGEITILTGRLFAPHLELLLRGKTARTGERVRMRFVCVPNRFFGRRVTVAGLLTGTDIAAAMKGRDPGRRVYIPPESVNADGLFLDGMSLRELERILGVPVQAGLRDTEF